MNAIQSMRELLAHDIQMLYSAETIALAGMPRMMEHATDAKLKAAFENHGRETEMQIARLEQIMQVMEIKPGREVCAAMKGIVADGEKLMNKDVAPEILDAMLIAAAQKIEHYEISCYGTAVYMTEEAGLTQVAELLRQTLAEEKKTDELLNQLAKSRVNPKAEIR